MMLLQGWKLGRIKVTGVQNQSKWDLKIETTNVCAFQLPLKVLSMMLDGQMSATIDGLELDLNQYTSSRLIMMRSDEKRWKSVEQSSWHNFSHEKRLRPLTQILNSTGPMRIIYGTQNKESRCHLQSVAKPLFDQSEDDGNLIIIGNTLDNCYFAPHVDRQSVEIEWKAGIDNRASFSVAGHEFDKPGQGILYQIPHPQVSNPTQPSATYDQKTAIVISGTDGTGIESALRLFPLRTGLNLPDWTVVDETNRKDGGTLAAGCGRYWVDMY
ncbi:uncharacterized protein MELLADRAFT_85362 [Melampsora larici-populina 98AG31]|nr:uncharacterized protein MELLADRAFT_85362 [Melampsora larici-populina 98AG31]EGF97431.1 hypothetical protein MELLADRAFT_85362 [Melampsora larici-populina 98AG31]